MSCRLFIPSLWLILFALTPSLSLAAFDPITGAEEAYSAGNYESAIRWYGEAVASAPDNQTALIGRLSALAALSRWEEVLNGIAGSDLDPAGNPKIGALYAEGYVQTGKPEEALSYLDTYSGVIGDDDDLRIRAEALIAQKKESEALSLLIRSENTGFEDPQLSLITGTLLSGERNMTGALPYLEAAVAGLPHDPRAPAELGKAISSLGRYEEGLIFTEKAVTLSPDDAELWVTKAFLLNQVGRHDDALDALDRALILTPVDPDLINARAYTLYLAGRSGEARRLAEEALLQNPADPAAMDTLGSVLLAEGSPEEAIRYLKPAADLLPGDPEVLTHLADAYRITGRYPESEDLYQRALLIIGASGETWRGYAAVLMKEEKYPEAASAIAESLRYYPNDPELVAWEQEADKNLIDWYLKEEAKKNSTTAS